MKILIICSKQFYSNIPSIKEQLEKQGHIISLPNSYDNPNAENESKSKGEQNHIEFKQRMFKLSRDVILTQDAVLVLNFEKNGVKNYLGGATFLEMYEAFMNNKKIFLYNDIPEGILKDEICGFAPILIHGDLNLVK